jgi:hypothetical protein
VSFLGWTFLFGAVAVAGPILAHMLAKPRFRRVPFTMLQFLRDGQHESRSRRKLRDLLVLLLRCTIIVLIAVLFARPVLHTRVQPPQHRSIHYLALDDSMSLAYREGGTSLFERMVGRAVDYVRRCDADASFNLCALASGRTVHDLTRSQAIAEIKRLAPVPKSARLVDFLSALKQAAQTTAAGDAISAVVISDFTPNILQQFERVREPAPVQEFRHEIIAPAGPWNNAAVVDARAVEVAGHKVNMDITVANYADNPQPRELTLKSSELRATSVKVDLAPHERRVVRMQADTGPTADRPDQVCLPVELTLAPNDGLAEDDTYRLAVYLPGTTATNILLVQRGEEGFLFETALGALAQQDVGKGLSLRKVQEGRLSGADLAWAHVVVFSSIPTGLPCPSGALKNHLAGGRKLIFFATRAGSRQMIERLLREGALPAVPDKWVPETVYPEPQPLTGTDTGSDHAVQSLRSYRFDKIALKGYWQCRPTPDAECLWRLSNGAGFLYLASPWGGSSLLVNTSMDDSLGLLAKSRAWVTFCRYLTGEADRLRQFCFSPEDRPVLSLPDSARVAQPTTLALENCDGSRTRATNEGTRVLLPPPTGLGWMKTLSEPVLYAAVNLPAGETDVSTSAEEMVAGAMKHAFVTGEVQGPAPVLASSKLENRPLWPAFAWAALLLLLLEPAITNRLKR